MLVPRGSVIGCRFHKLCAPFALDMALDLSQRAGGKPGVELEGGILSGFTPRHRTMTYPHHL